MRNIKILLILASIFITCHESMAQQAQGGCESVTITQIPNYPAVYNARGVHSCNFPSADECCIIAVWGFFQMMPQLWLQKLDDNGNWTTVQGPIKGGVGAGFTNLNSDSDHGVYRIKIQTPYYDENTCRIDGAGNIIQTRIKIFNQEGQYLGYEGTYDNSPFGGNVTYYTNSVIVGIVKSSDIAFHFVDGDGHNLNDFAFDYGETVLMDATASKNYTHWWVAIFEQAGQQRYRSNGWTNGPIGIFNLSDFWEDDDNWKFETYNSYIVQFAIVNDQCQLQNDWMNLDKSFFICPTGIGCKYEQQATSISVNPNPVTSSFRFTGIHVTPVSKFSYEIRSIDGRLCRMGLIHNPSDMYDVSGLESGIYLVSVIKDDARIYNSKISVIK